MHLFFGSYNVNEEEFPCIFTDLLMRVNGLIKMLRKYKNKKMRTFEEEEKKNNGITNKTMI